MATVTGLTAERTLQIEAAMIVALTIDASNHIILTKHDGSTIDCGPLPPSSDTAQGIVELATSAETITGTDTARATTPKGVADAIANAAVPAATTTVQGKVELATNAETTTGTDTVRATTPAGVAAAITAAATPAATTSVQGKIEIATVGEGYVGTDSVRAVTPAGLAAMLGSGLYVPSGWGANWRAKRDAAGSGKAVIGIVGSSSAQGLYCGNLLTDSWASKLRTQLQTQYGAGGSGFFAVTRSLTFFGAGTVYNAWDALAGNLASVSGTWSNGNNYGPGGQYIYTGTAGGYITFAKVNGTTIKIYTMSGGGRANWQYQIDGGSIVSINDSGTASIQVTTVTGLTAGDHTVKLIQNSAAGTNFSPCGVAGENATGVIVNNYGLSGATSATFQAATNEIYQPQTWNGGPDYPCDLLIYTLGANDANAGTATDTVIANAKKFLSNVRDGQSASAVKATGTTDILIMAQHIGKYDNATPKWQDYSARFRDLAETFGAAYLNMWTRGKTSYNNWDNAGNWGNSGATGGVSGTDTVHMSNAGHTAVYNDLLPILTA